LQWRNEAVNAANDVIDRLLSSPDFAKQASVVTEQIQAAPPQTDANGDGVADIKVTFPEVTIEGVKARGPRCLRHKPVPDMSLNPLDDQDAVCLGSRDPNNSGVGIVAASGSGSGTTKSAEPSLCANTEWSITVQADDAVTNTQVQVTQGVGVRVMRQIAENYCK
jgi:hypothetical protein